MCPTYLWASTTSRAGALSNPASRHRCCSNSSGSGRSTTTASIVASSGLKSGTLAPATTTPSGPPSASTSGLFLVPGLPRSVGSLPVLSPPGPGLARHPVGRLPLPSDRPEFVALRDQHRPDPLEDAVAAPPPEPAVHRAIVAEVLRQPFPLAAGTEAEDDAVDRLSPADAGPTAMLLRRGWGVLQEDRLDPLPEGIGDFPDRLQRQDITLRPRQGGVS